MIAPCPHGDKTCPCQDGDSCHYEGRDPLECPNPPEGLLHPNPHCHVEGCRWWKLSGLDGGCGLAKIGHTWSPSGRVFGDFRGAVDWRCGTVRHFMSHQFEGAS